MIDPVEIVRKKEAELKQANKLPAMIMLTEILNEVTELAKEELRQAVINGTLTCHKTLNDVVFNVNSNG